MTAAWILGPRGAEDGVFIAPPGVDAATATPSQLTLHVTSALAQIYLRGTAAPPFPRTVIHTLGFAPIVLPNIISTDLTGLNGYVRPFDNTWAPWTNSQVQSGVSQFTVFQSGSGQSLNVNYTVINRPLPQ